MIIPRLLKALGPNLGLGWGGLLDVSMVLFTWVQIAHIKANLSSPSHPDHKATWSVSKVTSEAGNIFFPLGGLSR